jgi:hypothetical protein
MFAWRDTHPGNCYCYDGRFIELLLSEVLQFTSETGDQLLTLVSNSEPECL